jgi:adenosyl cobinamide kinase/adenosyl cobinamide phosphate guanylyltransferase
MGADMRKWREAVGRSMAVIAGVSDEVIRLFCGIPQRVK